MGKRGVADIGAVVVIIILLVIIASGLIIKVSSRECYSNKNCEKNSYCGSDFSCHPYPILKETEIIERQSFIVPSIIVALGLVGAAYIFRNKEFPSFLRRKPGGNHFGKDYPAEKEHGNENGEMKHENAGNEMHQPESHVEGEEQKIVPYYESISESYSSEEGENEQLEVETIKSKPAPKAGKKVKATSH